VKRLLPPLLLLGLLAIVAWRALERPSRDQDRADIEARWAAVDGELGRPALLRAIDRYLAAYGDAPEERWFVARAYVKAGRVDEAARVVFEDPAHPPAPGAAHRFGHMLLGCLGWDDDEHLELPRAPAALAALALADGGDGPARAWIERFTTGQPPPAVIPIFYGAFSRAGPDVLAFVGHLLRRREEPLFAVSAAIAFLGREPYAERDADLHQLLAFVDGTTRKERRPLWSAACMALGRSEDPEAVARLQRFLDQLAESDDERDREDAALAASGLVAAGHWEAEWWARKFFGPHLVEHPNPMMLGWYAEAVLWRYRVADPLAPDRLRRVWDAAPFMRMGEVRARMATTLLLRGPLPRDDLPLQPFLADLQAPEAPLAARVVAMAYRLRRGEADAGKDLVGVLTSMAKAPSTSGDAGLVDANLTSPVLTACRALYLWGGPPDR
jgi:hypothetical protein